MPMTRAGKLFPPELRKCFFICPIGDEGSDIRKRSDKILQHVIRPTCDSLAIKATRADEINEPSLISRTVIREILSSDFVIADLTGYNPNVFYELAIRHFTGKPTIHLIESDQKIPFDVASFNTILIEHNDIDSVLKARDVLRDHIKNCLKHKYCENPVSIMLDSLGFDLPIDSNKKPISEQFSDMCTKVISELESSRDERNMLFEKLLKQSVESHNSNNTKSFARGDSIRLFGEWNSNLGPVRIGGEGNDIIGEYCYHNNEWVGEFVGKIIQNKIIMRYHWKTGAIRFNGIAYWVINSDTLNGTWWYGDELKMNGFDYENKSYDYFYNLIPDLVKMLLKTTEDREWVLWRDANVGQSYYNNKIRRNDEKPR